MLACREAGSSDYCVADRVLLVDYVLSLQYYLIFRWDNSNGSVLDLASDANFANSCSRLDDHNLLCQYLTGIKSCLDEQLYSIACKLLLEQIDVVSSQSTEKGTSAMPASQPCLAVPEISIQKLHIYLLEKLEEEKRRHTYLASTAVREREDVFNETDRIVANLLNVKSSEGQPRCYSRCPYCLINMSSVLMIGVLTQMPCTTIMH